jgi:amino acid transporter
MRRFARYLNGFILTGIALLFISIAGILFGERVLTEPGQPANPLAWLWYLIAAAVMLVNGVVSIRTAAKHTPEPEAPERKREGQAKP